MNGVCFYPGRVPLWSFSPTELLSIRGTPVLRTQADGSAVTVVSFCKVGTQVHVRNLTCPRWGFGAGSQQLWASALGRSWTLVLDHCWTLVLGHSWAWVLIPNRVLVLVNSWALALSYTELAFDVESQLGFDVRSQLALGVRAHSWTSVTQLDFGMGSRSGLWCWVAGWL